MPIWVMAPKRSKPHENSGVLGGVAQFFRLQHLILDPNLPRSSQVDFDRKSEVCIALPMP
jgi:hypothetical protein